MISIDKGRITPDLCVNCSEMPTNDGHDACLGILPCGVANACCGHGNNENAYIQFFTKDFDKNPNKYRVEGEEARALQNALIDLRDQPQRGRGE